MRDSLFALLLTGCIVSAAAVPTPILDYDFAKVQNSTLADSSGSGMDLKVEEKARLEKDSSGAFLASDGIPESGAKLEASKESLQKWKEKCPKRAIAASFRIKFNKLGASADFGIFSLEARDDGRLVLRFRVKNPGGSPNYRIMSEERIKAGQFYHFAFSYSVDRQEVCMMLDGKIQANNAGMALNELEGGNTPSFSSGLDGAIGEFRLYGCPVSIEDLSSVTISKEEMAQLEKSLADLQKNSKNKHLLEWGKSLEKTLKAIHAASRTPLGQFSELKDEIEKLARLASDLRADKSASPEQLFVTYIVPPLSSEPRLPSKLPEDGAIGREIKIVAAQGEFEPASIVVVSFAPIGKLELQVSDLVNAKERIPAKNIDRKLVKCWYQSGNAWYSYHADRSRHVLVPELLLNDDELIKVDEKEQANYLRMDYPDGVKYQNISRLVSKDPVFNYMLEPVHDAASLKPVALKTAGRAQQFFMTVKVPEKAAAGLYRGTLDLLADGKKAESLEILLRVLPFQLPAPKTNYDLTRDYIVKIHRVGSSISLCKDRKTAEKRSLLEYRNLFEHNAYHPDGPDFTSGDTELAKRDLELRREAGLPCKPLFAGYCGRAWGDNGWATRNEKDMENRSDELLRQGKANFGRYLNNLMSTVKETLGHNDVYFYGTDETGGYLGLIGNQAPFWAMVHAAGGKVMAAGWTDNFKFVPDTQDMHCYSSLDRTQAEYWHSVGGRILNYANPFAGPENPMVFRRGCGLKTYKTDYDGMFILSHYDKRYFVWNEFQTGWPTGSYRGFNLVYPTQDGPVDTLAYEGVREGIDDLRYCTLFRQLAERALRSDNYEVQRAAKRHLAWFIQLDGERSDLDGLRTELIDRILNLRELLGEKQ